MMVNLNSFIYLLISNSYSIRKTIIIIIFLISRMKTPKTLYGMGGWHIFLTGWGRSFQPNICHLVTLYPILWTTTTLFSVLFRFVLIISLVSSLLVSWSKQHHSKPLCLGSIQFWCRSGSRIRIEKILNPDPGHEHCI